MTYTAVDVEGNDAINRFHRFGGWQLSDSLATREGRLMYRITLAVDGHSCSK
jgi:hypothetical protein